MKITLIIALLFAPLTMLYAAEKPNIIFILFDDLGYGQPPCYNPKSKLPMPNLDRLATQGMRFTDAHSAAPICTPSRYGLMTGRYPWRIGQYGVFKTYAEPLITKDRLSVASFLKTEGYQTACMGKWHLGMTWDKKEASKRVELQVGDQTLDGPITRGFDYFFGYTHAEKLSVLIEQDRVKTIVADNQSAPLIIQKAKDFLQKQTPSTQPFFLYLPLPPPHLPLAPSEEYVGKSGGIDTVKKKEGYADWLYQGDAMLGMVMDSLEKNKLSDRTLIIVSSDNGAAGRAYPPLRDSKLSIYEGGHRVPFVARWPGVIQPGSLSGATISLVDFFATCADLLGKKLPDNVAEDSVSILPLLKGNPSAFQKEAVLCQDPQSALSIRRGPWQLIFRTDGTRELYNLKEDLGQTHNLASTQPELLSDLSKQMQRYMDSGRTTPGEPQKNDVEISLSKLSPKKGKNK